MSPDGWRLDRDRNQGSLHEPGFWMTRHLLDGWQIHVRLVTNGYQTAIDQIRVESAEPTPTRDIRGRIDLPTGDPKHPTWQRITLPTAKREASEALQHALQELQRTNIERHTALPAGSEPADHREQIDRILAMVAEARGFTTTNTQPREHPPTEKELHLAIIAAAYAAARAEHPTHPRQGTHRRLQQVNIFYAPATIGPLITQARAANMLTPTRRGSATGQLTEQARQLLTDADFHAPWYDHPRPPPNPSRA